MTTCFWEMARANLASVSKSPSLYKWAGGSDAFSRMINAFYDRVEQDDLLSPSFPAAFTRTTGVTWPPGGARYSVVPLNTPKTWVATRGC